MISPVLAAHFVPPSESAGGGIALAIILGAVIAFFLVYRILKRRRRPEIEGEEGIQGDDGGE